LKNAPEYLLIGDLGGRYIPKARKIPKKKQREGYGFWDYLGMSFSAVMIALTLALLFAFGEEPWRVVAWTLILLAIALGVVLIAKFQTRKTKQ
jgi:hypothetical protein